MKNGLYWFSKLDKHEQIRFCRNVTNYGHKLIGEYLLRDFDSLEDFMLNAFVWKPTPEGYGYWYETSKREL